MDNNGVLRGSEIFGGSIPTFTDCQGRTRYVHEDLVNLRPSLGRIPLVSHRMVIQKCRDDNDNLKVYTQIAQQWFDKTSVGRFITLGINPGHHTVSEMENVYNMPPERALDSADWLYFQHFRLVPMRNKFTDLFLNDQQYKWRALRTLVNTAWNIFLRSQSKHMQRVAPDSTVIALLPCFRDVIVLGDECALDIEELCTFMAEKMLSINRWNTNIEQSVMIQMVDRGCDPALVEFYRLEDEKPPSPSTDGLTQRNNALTEVCCDECDESFSSVATAMRHFNRNGKRCIQRFVPRPTMLTLVSSPASLGLVCASGMDPSLTSCHDMDLLWSGYLCLSCDGGFKGNWRECVKHFRSANHHDLNDGDVVDYYSLFTRLDSTIYDLSLVEHDKPLWNCGHCSHFVEKPATRDQIVDHVTRAHELHAFELCVPDDFFYVGL
ncbi:hypothetical protein V5O48_008307 [Marasmius crinis-equi]|uniref:C2H2-type domain-containing protein n=1 Tax=Marasmius crinis-equi TaxID=585013 RepID=A0ABR3FEG6_9AGAR